MDEVPAGATDRPPESRGLRGFLRRLTSSKAELEAEELQKTSDEEGATPIKACATRRRACVAGTLRTVTLRPRGGAPALEAELYDGSDVIDLVWLGRRRIAGIEPGRLLRAEGLVSVQDGRKVMFNPRYELRGGA
jgi:hypothetical protein